jgi:hypothetical protein
MKAEARKAAKETVRNFIDAVRGEFEHFHRVEIQDQYLERLSAIVTLVMRVAGSNTLSRDSGDRLLQRLVSFGRMFAFMSGRLDVSETDVVWCIRIALSQLPVTEHRVIQYAQSPARGAEKWWSIPDLIYSIGLTRRILMPVCSDLADLGILERTNPGRPKAWAQATYEFRLSEKARELLGAMDPGKCFLIRPAELTRTEELHNRKTGQAYRRHVDPALREPVAEALARKRAEAAEEEEEELESPESAEEEMPEVPV